MKKSKLKLPEAYDSLDAPVFVWQKVHETSDVSWLLIKRKKLNAKLRSALQKIWEKIYDEYLAEFGFSEEFINIKDKELEIAKLQLQMILTGDRTKLAFIEIARIELDEMKKEIGKANFMTSKIAIENKFKFQINMMTTSIREFYSYIKNLK